MSALLVKEGIGPPWRLRRTLHGVSNHALRRLGRDGPAGPLGDAPPERLYGGKFMRRSRSWKRGSERRGSKNAQAFRKIQKNDRSAYPFSSHLNASALLPGCAFWNSTPATISAASDVSYLRPEAERDARFSILYPPSIRQLTSFGTSDLACRTATFRLLFV